MVELSKGVELRANMDLEIARAPALINGAGIIAVIAFLQATVEWVDRFRRTIWSSNFGCVVCPFPAAAN